MSCFETARGESAPDTGSRGCDGLFCFETGRGRGGPGHGPL